MKTITQHGYDWNCYQDADMDEAFWTVVKQAKQMWADECEQYMKNEGDVGTCVLGAGIEVDYLRKRCRNPTSYMLIRAHDVTGAQSSLVWEKNVGCIVSYLRANGIKARYACGRMD